MTVDVEDYFQVSAFDSCVDRHEWESWPRRVERNTDVILEMFDKRRVVSTFFVLGWIAERHPALMQRIVGAGHEIASHGYGHQRVHELTRDAFYQDVDRTKKILEDLTGQRVAGYRAPSFSLNDRTPWAYEVLIETGYRYSSSIYPIRHDHYGAPDAPRFPYRPVPMDKFLEVPVTTIRLFGRNLPCGGGGYFRLLPYTYTERCIRRVHNRDRAATIFYFHPWEIDPDQPRVTGVQLRSRLRHYTNLKKMAGKLDNLLETFSWTRLDHLFPPEHPIALAQAAQ